MKLYKSDTLGIHFLCFLRLLQRFVFGHETLELPEQARVSGAEAALSAAETLLDAGRRQVFLFSDGTRPPLSGDGHAFVRARDGDCSEAYLITLPAARELLRVNSPMVVTLDSWTRFAARGHIELYRATPATATQDHAFQSVVPVLGRPSQGFLRLLWNAARLIEKPLDALWFRLARR